MTPIATSSNASLSTEKMPASIPYFLNEQLFGKLLSDDSSWTQSDGKHSTTTASNSLSPVTKARDRRKRSDSNNRLKSRPNSSPPTRANNYYTLAGRTQQNSRHFARSHCQPAGTFLTQYRIRENYKFLQMISVPPLDPAVPKPEGGTSVPACGEPLLVPASFPQSLEAALHKFANSSSKSSRNRFNVYGARDRAEISFYLIIGLTSVT